MSKTINIIFQFSLAGFLLLCIIIPNVSAIAVDSSKSFTLQNELSSLNSKLEQKEKRLNENNSEKSILNNEIKRVENTISNLEESNFEQISECSNSFFGLGGDCKNEKKRKQDCKQIFWWKECKEYINLEQEKQFKIKSDKIVLKTDLQTSIKGLENDITELKDKKIKIDNEIDKLEVNSSGTNKQKSIYDNPILGFFATTPMPKGSSINGKLQSGENIIETPSVQSSSQSTSYSSSSTSSPRPVGKSTRCKDGSISFSSGRGTCSHHGGIRR